LNLRDSREKGIIALYDLQPVSISGSLLAALFQKSSAMSTELISRGVTHKNPDVRRIAVGLLAKRNALSQDVAEQLLDDENADVRLEAVKTLISDGRVLSEDEIKKVLIKPKATGGIFGALSASDREGEVCWKRFENDRLRAMSDGELEGALREVTVFDMAAHFVYLERHFAKYGDELRLAIRDRYETKFLELVEKFATYGPTYETTKGLSEYLRKGLTRSGLDIICRIANPDDLGLIRGALIGEFVVHGECDIEYLGKFGEWQDIPLIVGFVEKPSADNRYTLLSLGSRDSMLRIAAAAICKIGRHRLAEVLALPMPSRLLAHIVIAAVAKEFRALGDPSVLTLLQSASDDVRKFTVMKCITCLSKRRLSQIWDVCANREDVRYYNVIRWLDFGVSMQRERTVPTAAKIIREWLGDS